MIDIQQDIHLIWSVNSADIEALEDARITLNSIKKADPGTYDEMIDESLRLIAKALNISCYEAIDRISQKLGVET